MEIIVPPVNTDENGDIAPWPTLGPQVVDFIERKFTYGPGPLKGQPYIVRDEFRYLIYRMYEHYPEDFVIDYDGELVEKSGRRRFNRVILSLPKGSSKTEFMSIISLTELHPDAPVRFNGYDDEAEGGLAPGRAVLSPFIPLIAPNLEQVSELAYGVASEIVREIDDASLFDPTQARILINGEADSMIKPVSASAGRLDGGKPTFQGVDEPLALDTEVPTTEGFKTIDTLQPGDFVFDRNGSPVRVLGKSDVHEGRPCYQVTFGNGERVITDSKHRWKAILTLEGLQEKVTTTLEIRNSLLFGGRAFVPRDTSRSGGYGEIVSIRRVKSVPVQCIEVDSNDHLFVFGRSGYLTHNTHRFIEDRHIKAFDTMMNNLPKRLADDPWQLSTTTAGDPSEASVALAEYRHGMKIFEGKIQEPNTLFYHRQTSDENAKFDTMGQRLRALKEASGEDAAKFRDLVSVAAMWDDENNDHSYLERVWCNRWVQSSTSAFDAKKFRALGDPTLKIFDGSRVTLGMDGALNNDSTAIVATDVDTGIQNVIGLWERPDSAKTWTVPIGEVYEVVADAFRSFNVEAFYADPPYWQQALADWSQLYGDKVVEWPTRNELKNYYAIRAYAEAITLGEVGHDGQKEFEDHIANAGKNFSNRVDDEGNRRYVLAKRNRDKKIDICVAAYLSWQARLDVISGSDVDESEEYYTIPQKVR